MTYQFLHHLTQADLPVVIYEQCLIKKLNVYEHQSLIVLARPEVLKGSQFDAQKGVQVLKITRTGRRAVRRHLEIVKHVNKNSD